MHNQKCMQMESRFWDLARILCWLMQSKLFQFWFSVNGEWHTSINVGIFTNVRCSNRMEHCEWRLHAFVVCGSEWFVHTDYVAVMIVGLWDTIMIEFINSFMCCFCTPFIFHFLFGKCLIVFMFMSLFGIMFSCTGNKRK